MLDIVIEARKASLATGLDVRRILPFRLKRMVGPFIFMDHAGPVAMQPAVAHNMDVLPHPHIGLSTVSYLFGGQVTHRDSTGVEQIIRPGEVNWMTAGSGIAHSERFEEPRALAGGALEMIQHGWRCRRRMRRVRRRLIITSLNNCPFTLTRVYGCG